MSDNKRNIQLALDNELDQPVERRDKDLIMYYKQCLEKQLLFGQPNNNELYIRKFLKKLFSIIKGI